MKISSSEIRLKLVTEHQKVFIQDQEVEDMLKEQQRQILWLIHRRRQASRYQKLENLNSHINF